MVERVPAAAARRLLLAGAGLLDDPARRATRDAVYRQIERMGYVQIDTINAVERAHQHILYTRLDGYRPALLARLLERERRLFEHWTHDASIIPTTWFAHWKHRFRRLRTPSPRALQRLGPDPDAVLRHVRGRIRREGPLMSRDFEDTRPEGSAGWWDWKPTKMALEFLWRRGELCIAERRAFQKVYELTARFLPDQHRARASSSAAHVDWACREALERLGVATPSELREFFAAISLPDARQWCARAAKRGDVVAVQVETEDGAKPRPAYALPDWRERAARLPDAPERMRLLSPFDPVVRDRRRALRLFGFDYTFEAYVPEPKRAYGYYVLPLLEGERLVGRVDPKHHRERETLEIRKLWWEKGVRATAARRRALEQAAGRLAEQLGARRADLPARRSAAA